MNINSVNIFFKVLRVIPGNRSSFTGEWGERDWLCHIVGFSTLTETLMEGWWEHQNLPLPSLHAQPAVPCPGAVPTCTLQALLPQQNTWPAWQSRGK